MRFLLPIKPELFSKLKNLANSRPISQFHGDKLDSMLEDVLLLLR